MPLKFFSRRDTFPFDTTQGLVIVKVRIAGPNGIYNARVALDTGASGTLTRSSILVTFGYDLSAVTDKVPMTTGSGIESVPRLTITKIEVLGQVQNTFPLVAYTLPPTATVDGLLGLDFLRNYELTIDFRHGWITLQ